VALRFTRVFLSSNTADLLFYSYYQWVFGVTEDCLCWYHSFCLQPEAGSPVHGEQVHLGYTMAGPGKESGLETLLKTTRRLSLGGDAPRGIVPSLKWRKYSWHSRYLNSQLWRENSPIKIMLSPPKAGAGRGNMLACRWRAPFKKLCHQA